jgi:amino acid transporter
VVAANNSGPAVILSFLLAAVVAGFAALCYAELVSLLPIAGVCVGVGVRASVCLCVFIYAE